MNKTIRISKSYDVELKIDREDVRAITVLSDDSLIIHIDLTEGKAQPLLKGSQLGRSYGNTSLYRTQLSDKVLLCAWKW